MGVLEGEPQMKMLWRYYALEFIKAFAIVGAGFSVMLASVDLIDKLDNIQVKTTASLAGYFLFVIPQYLVYTMPMASLFAALFTAGQAMRTKEAVAVMAAGGRLRSLFMPIAVIGVLLSLFSFGISEFIAPAGMREAKKMTGGQRASLFEKGTLWLRAEDGSLVRFFVYSKEEKSAKGVSIFRFEGGGFEGARLSERLEAAEANYGPQGWVLKNVTRYEFLNQRVEHEKTLPIHDFISTRFLEKEIITPEEMGIKELYDYSGRLEKAGIKNKKISVDMHSRLSYPFVNFFMVLLGIALSVKSGMGGLASTSLGVAVSLLYWFGYTMGLSLGYAGIFPPALAAWVVPLLFAVLSLGLFVKIRE
jgi:lipopolysaccharide export system permease protein